LERLLSRNCTDSKRRPSIPGCKSYPFLVLAEYPRHNQGVRKTVSNRMSGGFFSGQKHFVCWPPYGKSRVGASWLCTVKSARAFGAGFKSGLRANYISLDNRTSPRFQQFGRKVTCEAHSRDVKKYIPDPSVCLVNGTRDINRKEFAGVPNRNYLPIFVALFLFPPGRYRAPPLLRPSPGATPLAPASGFSPFPGGSCPHSKQQHLPSH